MLPRPDGPFSVLATPRLLEASVVYCLQGELLPGPFVVLVGPDSWESPRGRRGVSCLLVRVSVGEVHNRLNLLRELPHVPPVQDALESFRCLGRVLLLRQFAEECQLVL